MDTSESGKEWNWRGIGGNGGIRVGWKWRRDRALVPRTGKTHSGAVSWTHPVQLRHERKPVTPVSKGFTGCETRAYLPVHLPDLIIPGLRCTCTALASLSAFCFPFAQTRKVKMMKMAMRADAPAFHAEWLFLRA